MALDYSQMYYDPANSQANNPIPMGQSGVANYSGPIGPSKPGFIQGTANTVADPVYQAPTNNTAPTNTNTDGGSGGPDLSNPVKQREYAQSQGYDSWEQMMADQARQSNADIMKEVDDAYNGFMSAADQQQNTATNSYNSLNSDISNIFNQQRDEARTGVAQGNRSIDETSQESLQGKNSIIDQARRSLQEAGIGAGQRFGQGSDMARALGEYATTGFQRASASAHDTYQNAQVKLNNQRMKLQEDYTSFINKIGVQETTQKNDAYRNFQDVLAQINTAKATAGVNRSQMRVQAIQDLRDNLMNISLNALALKQQAEAQASTLNQNLQSTLSSNLANTNEAGVTFNDNISNINTGQDVPGSFSQMSPGYDITNDATLQSVGSINKKDEGNFFSNLFGF
jgi:hypothetical protein